MNRQRQAEARVAFEKSIQLYPTSGALSNYATLEFRDKRFAEAAAIYEARHGNSARETIGYGETGSCLARHAGENRQESRPGTPSARRWNLPSRSDERDPKNGMLAAQLADCHAKLGNEAEARRLLAEAEKLAARTMRRGRSWPLEIYEDMGDRDAALRLLGVGFARGLPREEVEQASTFDKLRADPALPGARRAPGVRQEEVAV